ncbi:hypothetical protein B296_00017967 [Ensete ventricosum]|uniref:Uncharacterized protein n=1 Tax=Ensete ventricosum TaxID=4639 RepID=A0A426XGL6_ENSVE|nr:hypothetical protein B296_00017967 [Ensete ventricosum]
MTNLAHRKLGRRVTSVISKPSEGNEERGRPVMARPFARATGHDQALCKGSRLCPGPLQGQPHATRATSKGGRRGSACPRPARRGVTPIEAPPTGIAPAYSRVRSRRKFARRFVEGTGKLVGNTKGDHRKEDRRTCRKIVGGYRSMRDFGHPLLFSSLPLRKSYEIILEEFRCRDPLCGYR